MYQIDCDNLLDITYWNTSKI